MRPFIFIARDLHNLSEQLDRAAKLLHATDAMHPALAELGRITDRLTELATALTPAPINPRATYCFDNE